MYWSVGGRYDSGNISAGAADIAVTITGRTPGLTYNITMVALSDHLPSPTVGAVMVTLGEPHVLTGSVGCIDISHTLCLVNYLCCLCFFKSQSHHINMIVCDFKSMLACK